ncbi:MAG: hypothetical protein JNN04_13815 [Cyclobacteriaceae bacterium]|nr:hypothetical protein [Cyclobacteriaceae bacterium]
MDFICPKCHRSIRPEEINIATDLAKCTTCGTISKASQIILPPEDSTLAAPPKGASIQMSKEAMDGVKLFLPSKGLTASDIPKLVFIIFWIGFIAFWTWGASQASITFAMFSIPFWIVGITMGAGIVNSINETQSLIISKGKLVLDKSRPIGGVTIEYDLHEIMEIKMHHPKMGPFSAFTNPALMWRFQWSFGSAIVMPAIISGSATEYFFESANDAEQSWTIQFLNTKLKQANR